MTTAADSPRPHRTIRPPGTHPWWVGWAALDVREVWAYRDLLLVLAGRDVKLRYRQTALGALWVLFQPLMAAGIFTFIFGKVAGIQSEVPYFAFALAGQMAWQTFANTLNKTATSLVQNSALVSKVYFPRLVLPLSTVFSSLVDFGVMLAVLIPALLLLHVGVFWGIVFLPVWFLLIALMALGVGLMAGALMVSYRDVQYVVPVLINLLMFASPVAVPLGGLLGKWGASAQAMYFLLNPLAALIEAFHWSLFGRMAASWGMVGYAAIVAVGIFALGAVVFRNGERRFADVI